LVVTNRFGISFGAPVTGSVVAARLVEDGLVPGPVDRVLDRQLLWLGRLTGVGTGSSSVFSFMLL
jgi:hypothetical protein